jgi:hypothetical protein
MPQLGFRDQHREKGSFTAAFSLLDILLLIGRFSLVFELLVFRVELFFFKYISVDVIFFLFQVLHGILVAEIPLNSIII